MTSIVMLAGCQAIIGHMVLPRDAVRPAEYAVRVDHEVPMTTSDGVRLKAELYHPVTDKPMPTILVRLPYSRSFKADIGLAVVGRYWASRGYHVMVQASRGRHGSGGEFYPLRDERRDGIETLRWLAQQPWYDGRLGMWGGSAFGYTEWALADQKDPGPSALMIQIASSHFHEMFYPGGAFSLESALYWALRSRSVKDEHPSAAQLDRGVNGFPMIQADDRAAGDIAFFNDWASHPDADAYWKAIDGEQRARSLTAPVLLIAGWSDPFLPSQLRDFEAIRAQADPRVARESRLIIGPWSHAESVRFPDGTTGDAYRQASLGPSIPWFDHLLLGRPLDHSLTAPVRLFVMGENVWRDEQDWPLARARPTIYFLRGAGHANTARGDGLLSLEPPVDIEPSDTYVYDPKNPVPSLGGAMLSTRAGIREQSKIERRADVLIYSTEPLTTDAEVTGPVSATLYVETTVVNTDFTVKLVDVHPDGKVFNVSDGILRRAYSKADGAVAAAEAITIELWPTSMLFKQGHRIRIEVSSSNFPRYDRNTNTGRDAATDGSPVVAMQTIHHSPQQLSSIMLPIIAR
jgi:putative CocE/NonD family hydrolase